MTRLQSLRVTLVFIIMALVGCSPPASTPPIGQGDLETPSPIEVETPQPTSLYTPIFEELDTFSANVSDWSKILMVYGFFTDIDLSPLNYHLVNLETGNSTNLGLTKGQGYEIAFWKSSTGNIYLNPPMIVNIDTGSVTNVHERILGNGDGSPDFRDWHWAQSGDLVVMSAYDSSIGSVRLDVYQAPDWKLQASRQFPAGFYIVSISNKGDYIALLQEYDPGPSFSVTFPSDAYLWEWTSDEVIRLTEDEPGQLAITWSPDDRLFAVISGYDGTLAGDGPVFGEKLAIYATNTREVFLEVEGNFSFSEETNDSLVFSHINWSRDSSSLAFANPYFDNGWKSSDICILEVENGNLTCPVSSRGDTLNLFPRYLNDSVLVFVSSSDYACYKLIELDVLENTLSEVSGDLCVINDIVVDGD